MGFIDDNYARSKNLPSSPLPQPRILRLADGTIAGTVTRYTTIRYRIGPIQEDVALYRWPLDGPDIILGLPWLRRHNPDINWSAGTLSIANETIAELGNLDQSQVQPITQPKPVTTPAYTPLAPTIQPGTLGESEPAIGSNQDTNEELIVRSLRAPNFLTFCKMKDVKVDSMPFQRFMAMTDVLRTITGTDPTSILSSDEMAETTPTDVLRKILTHDDTLDRESIPPRLRPFHDWVAEAPWLRKVTDEDIEKYLDGKPPATTDEILAKLPSDYHDLIQAFLPKEAEALPPHRPFDHKIELLPGQTPPHHSARAMSPKELLVVRKYIDDHLDKGFIRASTSSAAAPILLAKKPGGGVRICVDYRGLNNVTVKNRYPIPLIRETLDALCGAKIFTKLDIVAAFNRLRIAPGDEWKTAFITRFGLFECLVANFGMTGAPSSFQHYINHTLFDLLDRYCTAYLDDILIYSKNKQEHRKHVREVLRRLIDAGLTIDIRKCEFNVTKTRYLGLIISTDGIQMDPEKVKAIQSWNVPSTLRELQRFVGFANFYRRFIKNFSRIARPLTAVMSRLKWPGELPEDGVAAFHQLIAAFSTAPVLAYYDPKRKTVLEADASDWASGGVLSQYNSEGILRPVAYFSSKHSPAECNYEIYDKELLAIVKAFEEWRPELQGAEEPVTVITDHKNLQHFATTKLLNQRQVRWSEFLSDFRFQIQYRPGHKATIPDALSRLPGLAPRSRYDLADERVAARYRTFLPEDKWSPSLSSSQLYALDVSQPIDELVDAAYLASPLIQEILAALANVRCRRFKGPIRKELRAAKADCKVVQGRIYVRDKLFIPPNEELRLQILHRGHSAAPGGHPGRYKTYDLLRRTYYWPGLSRDVATFVKACHLCRRIKNSRLAPTGFLDPLPVPYRPWEDISVDYVGPLPPCERLGHTYEYILVVVDRLTKMRHFIPTTDMSAASLADAFVAWVYRLHGTPSTIISDRGTQFVSAFWRELSRRLGIALHASSAHHPESDGQTEVVNAAMEQYLRGYCSFYQDDWVDWLPLAEFAQNNHTSETIGVSPFFANYGFNPQMGTEPTRPPFVPRMPAQRSEVENAAQVADRIERVLERVRAFMAEAQERQREFADRHRSDAETYTEGDLVWVNTKYMKTSRPSPKLSDRWIGPYKVTKTYPRAVAVDLPPHFGIFPVFHHSLIRHNSPGLPGQEAINKEWDSRAEGIVPTTENDEEGPLWYFQSILNSRNTRKGLEYKVKWHAPHRPSWQPAADLQGNDEEIIRFHRDNPTKPGPPNWISIPQEAQQDESATRRRSAKAPAPKRHQRETARRPTRRTQRNTTDPTTRSD